MGLKVRPRLGILVADHHPIFRAGIKSLLTEMCTWQQYKVGEAETTEEAMARVASGEYKAVLMEYHLPGRGGIKATGIIRSRWPNVCVIGIMDSDDGQQADRILCAGASGCIMRNVGLDTLVEAIRTGMAGRRFLSNEIAQQLLDGNAGLQRDPLKRLSTREKEVFISILSGLGDKEIAVKMGIAKRSVDKHRQHINYKLGTRTSLELLQAGLRLGLVKVPE